MTGPLVPFRPAALVGCLITGLPMIPLMYAILQIPGDNLLVFIGPMVIILMSAGFLLGMAVAWRVQGSLSAVALEGHDADDRGRRDAEDRQATRAGNAGAVVPGHHAGVLPVLGPMMILGPLVAAGGAAFGAMTVVDRQLRSGPPGPGW